MTPLETVQPTIQRLITVLSKVLEIDLAVIDIEYHLVASTGTYLEHKGQSVHAPFVQEVLAHGKTLVFEPGRMPPCAGCRFQDRCPATAEILSSIRADRMPPLGVLSLSSFTHDGRYRLTQQCEMFLDILSEASNLIAEIAAHERTQGGAQTPKTKRITRGNCEARISFDDIKGDSEAMRGLKDTARRIARSSSTVLLTGETGTGKELLARAIHYHSDRRDSPFVAINCAGIPECLLESELFGYEEGAFTGARKGGKPGRFELAQGGTLFLDEIGDMPLHLQSKLLRVLQERAIQRVGGTGLIPIDVRLIAATNKNIEDMVEQGTFRRDLYYRINVIPLSVPPLRERPGDVEKLALFFLDKYRHVALRELGGFTSEAMDLLESYDWPGNVRELENAVEYAVNMETSTLIRKESLPPNLGRIPIRASHLLPLKTRVRDFERRMITEALDRHGWDLEGKAQAARELGIGIRTLYRKLELSRTSYRSDSI